MSALSQPTIAAAPRPIDTAAASASPSSAISAPQPTSSSSTRPPAASAPKLKFAAPATARSAGVPKPKAASSAASAAAKPKATSTGAATLRSAAPPLSTRRAAASSLSAAAPSSRPRSIVHRSVQVGSICVRVVESDIASLDVSAVVNAANTLSFTPMDGGISGALRRAMGPNCTGQKKTWWDDDGVQHEDIKLPVTQAGVQAATGALLARGVQHVIHAVGPTWTDFPIADSTFKRVMPMIRRTVRRVLAAASRMHATSCALPAISGGIFTHYRSDQPEVKNREQRAARRAVVESVLEWAMEQAAQLQEPSSIESVLLCDLSKRELGAVHVFVEEFDRVVLERKQKLEALAAVSVNDSQAAAGDASSAPAAAAHRIAGASSAGDLHAPALAAAPVPLPRKQAESSALETASESDVLAPSNDAAPSSGAASSSTAASASLVPARL